MLVTDKSKLQAICHSEDQTLPVLVPDKPKLQVVCHSRRSNPLLLVNTTPKLQAVCRAEGWGEWSRCAVRMTAKGSVMPWMACGSRPVEGSPTLGGFPDSRHTPRPGIAKGVAFSPLARRRSPEVNRSPLPARRNRNNPNRAESNRADSIRDNSAAQGRRRPTGSG